MGCARWLMVYGEWFMDDYNPATILQNPGLAFRHWALSLKPSIKKL